METVKLKELIDQMTVAEKVGQLVQLTPDFFAQGGEITGPMQQWHMSEDQLFSIGSVLGTHTAEQVYAIQTSYLEKSRLKIPLVFMADVIHGYETIFPIPLALASSFDAQLVEEVAKASAKEAAEAGVHVTFSPMADHVKDARWGRVLESNGEDPTLSAVLTAAYVRGYQGTASLAENKQRIAACVKHFIGYGAAEGGRDYHTVDLSDLELYQNYLPAFQAAIEAGAELVMTSFNTIHGVPATANQPLLQEVLREKLGFDGLIISDWAAVAELMAHRVAADRKEAAQKAFTAGVEMDMMSDCYLNALEQIIQADPAMKEQLNKAVFHVLHLKNKLGLFEDPYRGLAPENLTPRLLKETRLLSREAAKQTTVLLKNQALLPLQKKQKVALIGPKADSKDLLGAWSWIGKPEAAVSLAEGLSQKEIDLTVLPYPDGEMLTSAFLDEACKVAKGAEVVLLALGETSEEAGEAASLTKLTLSRKQEALIEAVSQVNPRIATILFCGRPLVLTAIEPLCQAIMIAWFPGSEGGNALADLLMGESEPQGRLAMSFPRAEGQLPLTYSQLSTGRPLTEENSDQKYISRYMDEKNEPLFSFGSGIGYSKCTITHTQIIIPQEKGAPFEISCTLKNEGDVPHTTTLQLYSRDDVTEVARPMRELKQWRKIHLAAAEERQHSFYVTPEDFAYVHSDFSTESDPGTISLYLGFAAASAKLIGTLTI